MTSMLFICILLLFFIQVSYQVSLPAISHDNHIIPLLSISLNFDRDNYLIELLKSIDYPIRKICIQVGNSDPQITGKIAKEVLDYAAYHPHFNISITSLNYNPGSTRGFNFGLKQLMSYDPILYPWCLIVNYDISFYPDTLRYLAYSVHHSISSLPTFGIGFLNLCCGGEWSAVVFSRRMVEVVGLFDENFYPAYYEDDDYGIRVYLASFIAERFHHANVSHGRVNGAKKYISGVESTLIVKKKDKKLHMSNITSLSLAHHIAWKSAFRLGIQYAREYIKMKWNIRLAATTIQPHCKSYRGINRLCKVGYKNPFGDESKPVSYWLLNQTRLDYLMSIENGTVTLK